MNVFLLTENGQIHIEPSFLDGQIKLRLAVNSHTLPPGLRFKSYLFFLSKEIVLGLRDGFMHHFVNGL